MNHSARPSSRQVLDGPIAVHLEVDEAEVARALSSMLDPASACQIQSLPGAKFQTIPAGDIPAAVRAVYRFSGGAGTYVNLNPIVGTPEKMARNTDIARRRLLLIDVDASKPKEHTHDSTTAAEKKASRAVTWETRDHLEKRGWPDPLVVDSGNNWQLLYLIDLPNDDLSTRLIRSILSVLAARFDTEMAHLDQAVYDARRIVKIPGTPVRKGTNTAERPHRLSRLVKAPAGPLGIVTAEQLWALVAEHTGPGTDYQPPSSNGHTEVPRASRTESNGLRPGDDFNAHATWAEILEPKGWKKLETRGAVEYWCRPGKDEGVSATINHVPDRLHNFTSSTTLAANENYRKFDAYTLLNHGGDYKAAAKALGKLGYGSPAKPSANGDGQSDADQRIYQTDLGNARRLVAKYGANLRYVAEWRKWLAWDGKRWRVDAEGQVDRYAKKVPNDIRRDAGAPGIDPEKAKGIIRWALKSEDKRQQSAMISLAWSEPTIPVSLAELDTELMLLNVRNGTIDLRTGKLQKHRREDLITQMAPVAFDENATCERWLETLNLVFGEDKELIDYFQRLCGLALTGMVTDLYLPILWGKGSNGKSTLISVLLDLLGDYAMKAPCELLMAGSGNRHPTERATLFGKRLVVVVETEDGQRLRESQVKELTSFEPISARRMREDFWSFKPTHKPWLCTNHKPEVRGTDHGIWRRLKLVPFNVVIADDKADKTMPAKLRKELPGILNWGIEGCLAWQKEGRITAPKVVEEATKKYRDDQDVVGAFLDEHCTIEKDLRAKSSATYARYLKFAEGFPKSEILSNRRLTQVLNERGYPTVRANGSWFHGFGLCPDNDGEDWTV
jgi:P4 family phage/plasmid primase-like protien